jgi:hypothetical protein
MEGLLRLWAHTKLGEKRRIDMLNDFACHLYPKPSQPFLAPLSLILHRM